MEKIRIWKQHKKNVLIGLAITVVRKSAKMKTDIEIKKKRNEEADRAAVKEMNDLVLCVIIAEPEIKAKKQKRK